ncbi:hypothetical protein NLY09_09050 (plasmid) [Burkholderia vietnamiensis]
MDKKQQLIEIQRYLIAKGHVVTLENIGIVMGMSAQAVKDQFFQPAPAPAPKIAKKKGRPSLPYVQALQRFDTSEMTVEEIQALPIDGIKHARTQTLKGALRRHGIPHVKHPNALARRLRSINTAQYTLEELQAMTGVRSAYLRLVLRQNKQPYKDADALLTVEFNTTEKIRVLKAQMLAMGKKPNLAMIARILKVKINVAQAALSRYGDDRNF